MGQKLQAAKSIVLGLKNYHIFILKDIRMKNYNLFSYMYMPYEGIEPNVHKTDK